MVYRQNAIVVVIVAMCLCTEYPVSSMAQQAVSPCIYPGDCLRHRHSSIIISWGKCESKSAWKENYINTTRDERRHMWKERGKPFSSKILDAYELTETQRESCNVVRDVFFSTRRGKMGQVSKELDSLLDRRINRLLEHKDAIFDALKGDDSAFVQLPDIRNDHVMNDLYDRFHEIDRKYPRDWSNLADRIEDVLPPEQAKRGRARLAAKFPFTVSNTHGQKLSSNDSKSRSNEAVGDEKNAIDRWDAYVLAFEKRHRLTSAQSTAAASILKELRETRAQLSLSMVSGLKRYENNKNSEIAQRRYELFELDVEDIFETLVIRLDALLTTTQRQTISE